MKGHKLDSSLDRMWREKPEVVRAYYEKKPVYERLSSEVAYILEKIVKKSGMEVGHITFRPKSLESFCEKIERKGYEDPINQITDLSGVRLVYLYISDKAKLEQLVESEFEVHEKVDKVKDSGADKFGYGALHYIVRLKNQHAGARYDDLRNLSCEIQIRTILQDSWATVAHHLSYKHEDDIPNELKRKLHALSGLFETADDQFERINSARHEYQKNVMASIESNRNLSLNVEINLDNLLAYINWKFSDRESSTIESVASLLEELNRFGYKKLDVIDNVINTTWDAILQCEAKYPPAELYSDKPTKYVGVGLIRSALEFFDPDYLRSRNSPEITKKISEFSHLVKRENQLSS